MKTNHLIILFFFCTIPYWLKAQDFSNHQWKDRLLIIKTKDLKDTTFMRQISELKKHIPDLEERKLIIYQIKDGQYKKGLSKDGNWNKIKTITPELKPSSSNFEISLIGLDGHVKLKQTEFLTHQELFGRIDAMPMRRQEIRNKR